jgi:cyclophilin family peptidyl-prolyl cis-trans isomerase
MRNLLTFTLLTALTLLSSSALAQTAPAAVTPQPFQKAGPQFIELQPLSSARVLKFDAPKWVIDPAKAYRVVLETTQGKMTVELYPQVAPKTVNSFVYLALNNYYNGVPFHRVLENFMAQTGDPTGTGTGGPGYQFFVELDSKYGFDKPGVLGMARSQSFESNGSQFFITFVPYKSLSGQYTVFGQLLEGADVLSKIAKVDPQNPKPDLKPDLIERVIVLEEAVLKAAPENKPTTEPAKK